MLVALEDTPLSFIEFSHPSRSSDPLGVLEDMLRSHDGVKRRRCHFIRLHQGGDNRWFSEHDHLLPDHWYRLPPPQSECLGDILHSYPEYFFNPFTSLNQTHTDIIARRIEEIILSLTDYDLLPPPNLEVKSSKENVSLSSDGKNSKKEADFVFAEHKEDDGKSTGDEINDSGKQRADNDMESSMVRLQVRK